MATPIGHALAGYAVYRVSAYEQKDRRTLLWLCLFLAIAADFDLVPGILLGQPVLYHRGVSHSLGLALIVSLGFALIYGLKKGTVWTAWGWFFLTYTSHLVMDFFGVDKRPPYGIPLFWPISGEYFLAPRPIFWGVHHAAETSASTNKWLISILTPRNLEAIGIEVMVTLPIIFLILLVQHFHGRIERHGTCREGY